MLGMWGIILGKGNVQSLISRLTEQCRMELHDPMCVWYALNSYRRGVSSGVEAQGKWSLQKAVDLRVETAGQWSMGACIVDRRDRKRVAEAVQLGEATGVLESPEGDTGGWLSEMRGNRIDICVGSPGASTFGDLILKTIFGSLSG